MEWSTWTARLRPPLGEPYDGVCRAADDPVHPSPEVLRDCCNMGYPSGRCPRFRAEGGDAVRFAIADAGGTRVIRWVIEAAGLPVLAGEVSAAALESGEDLKLARSGVSAQLRAYWASFRKASGD